MAPSLPHTAATPRSATTTAPRTPSFYYTHILKQSRSAYIDWQEWRIKRKFPSSLRRFALAAALIVGMLLIRLSLPLFTSQQEVYLLFIIPIFISAWFGGLSGGLFATFFATVVCSYYFIAPSHGLPTAKVTENFELLTFAAEGILVTCIVNTLRYTKFISEQRAEQMREDDERFRALIEGVTDYAIYMVDPHGFIRSWNDGAERITGYTLKEVIGRKSSLFHAPEDITAQRLEHDLKIATELGRHEGEGWRLRKDGSTFWANIVTTVLRDKAGTPRGFAKVIRDMTDQKQAEDTIRHQAYHDPLTSLPNRLALQEQLENTLRRAARNEEQIAVLFLDLDRFKAINDTLGHQTGDLLLQEVAKRLQSVVHTGDIVARFGGDEFIIILRGLRSSLDVSRVAENIANALRPSYVVSDQTLHITTSIGISMFPKDGTDVPTLLKNADSALYQAKRGGKDVIKMYAKTMNAKANERLSLDNELRLAVERNQLFLHYQPIFSLHNETIVGAEALVRWQHPELGLISPGEFIPLAEETGAIFAIGEWVFHEACCQIRSWKNEHIKPVPISVNLSPRQFNLPHLISFLEQQLKRCQIDPSLITIEITEGIAMQDIEASIARLTAINRMGMETAIDDFGIGFSSLNYMKRLPITKLKIDKSFVTHCSDDSRDAAIIKAIISMAKSLQLRVVAEGIEYTEQLNFLKGTRCDYGQGYLVSPPLSSESFGLFLQKA